MTQLTPSLSHQPTPPNHTQNQIHQIPQTLRDSAVFGLLSGEAEHREMFRRMLLFGENKPRLVVREMKHEISHKLRILFRFDWSILSKQYFMPVILDELLRSVQAEQGSGKSTSVLHIQFSSSETSSSERAGLSLLKHARELLKDPTLTHESLIPSLRYMIYASPTLCHSIFTEIFPVIWSNLPSCDRDALSDDLVVFLSQRWHENQPIGFLDVAKTVFSALPEELLETLPIDLIVHIGRRHNCWFVSIKALESLLYSYEDDDLKRRYETARQLESLYEDLNMKDLAFAVRRTYVQTETSRLGLSMETYDKVKEAHDLYGEAIRDFMSSSTSLSSSSPQERAMWENRWVVCSKKLLRWDTLSQFAKSTQDDQLRLDCAVKLGNWHDVRHLKRLVADSSTTRNCLADLCAAVLSSEDHLTEPLDRKMDRSNEAVMRDWHSLPRTISEAHIPLLHLCQMLVETREAFKIVRKIQVSNSDNSVPDLKSILSTWRERLPNKFDDTTSWSDIMRWRGHTFHYIMGSFRQEDALRHQLHDAPWTVIKLAHVARRHGLNQVSLTVLNRLSTFRQMDVQDAFEKLREQILICFANSKEPRQIKSGIRFINDTNLEYFSSNIIGRNKKISQKGEFFRLKGKFLMKLKETELANEEFSKCMRICDSFSKGWYTWACFLDKQYEETGDIKIAAQAVCGFLQAVNYNTEGARLSLARVIWLMSNDDENGMFLFVVGAWLFVGKCPFSLSLSRCLSLYDYSSSHTHTHTQVRSERHFRTTVIACLFGYGVYGFLNFLQH